MYENDIPEQVIKEITGHHSECVRTYKHTPDSIKERASMTIKGQNNNRSEVVLEAKSDESETVKRKCEDEGDCGAEPALKKRLEETLSACNIIKNVVKAQLETRK